MGGPEDGEQREQHHYHHVHAQTPEQETNSEGQPAWPEMSASLRCDQLVRFQQRQNYMRVLQVRLFRVCNNRIAFKPRLVAT